MSSRFITVTKIFWTFTLQVFFGVIVFFVLMNFGFFGAMPSLKELENPRSSVASEVIADDGTVLGKFYLQNRTNITFKDLPKNLVNALIATEDVRFYEHAGIDIKALAAVATGQLTGDNRGGGSTITQQLAKNLFPREHYTFVGLIFRKFKEWLIAIKLERTFTKEEIIAGYFNTVEFSDNAFGIKSAAQTYFNKPLEQLNIQESALLVGMLKATYKYNPRVHPKAALARRNVVINQLYEYDYIDKHARDSLFQCPIVLDYNPEIHFEGLAPYFREYLKVYLKDYFEKHPKENGDKYNIYKDGLKIYTTINPQMQMYAEAAVQEHLQDYQTVFFNHWLGSDPWGDFKEEWKKTIKNCDRYKGLKEQGKPYEEIVRILSEPVKMRVYSVRGELDTVMSPIDSIRWTRMHLQAGFLAMHPVTGHIKAWVGGTNYKYFQYDHVNVNTKRQVGSTFKPFVYTVAVDQKGYSPCTPMPNAPVTFEVGNPKWDLDQNWTPRNAGMRFGGTPNLKKALSQSLNSITARLMYEVGPRPVVELVKNLGFDSSTNIPPYPSICLGTMEISLYEMMGAYSAYANEGIYTKPLFITRITDKLGNPIVDFYPEQKEVLRPEVAFVMQEMMKGVVEAGTAKRLTYRYGLKGTICGKTGTTQSNSDGWFIGLTPDLMAGVWVGCEDRYIRFRSTDLGQGASLALPIWAKFFQKVTSDPKMGIDLTKKFAELPANQRSIIVDCSQYKGWGDDGVAPEEIEDYQHQYDNLPADSSDKEVNYEDE
jgi:penicillin-binding protein 1A